MIFKILLAALALIMASLPAIAQNLGWRDIAPEDLVLITTAHGTTVLELHSEAAPRHAERIRAMIRAGDLDGVYFYRVIDGFVAQLGPNGNTSQAWGTLKNENERPLDPLPFIPFGNDDLYAPSVGHDKRGFAMAQDETLGKEWFLHCPGAIAMARGNDPDSATTEFYIALDAQRYLDRNLTVFARVIDGMQYIQKVERGDEKIASGVIQPPRTGDKVISVRISSDLPAATRPAYQVQRPGTGLFEGEKRAARIRTSPFFYNRPAEVIDICDFGVKAQKVGR